jgi:hypothetical protein
MSWITIALEVSLQGIEGDSGDDEDSSSGGVSTIAAAAIVLFAAFVIGSTTFVWCAIRRLKEHPKDITDHKSLQLRHTALIMERLFSPCTRYRDIALSRGRRDGRHPERLQELNLDVSTQELLSAERAFTYADVYAMLGNQNTVVWLTPHAFIVLASTRGVQCTYYLPDGYGLRLNVDGKIFKHCLAPRKRIQRLLMLSVVYCWLM